MIKWVVEMLIFWGSFEFQKNGGIFKDSVGIIGIYLSADFVRFPRI
jgi:hypothetical protein